KAYFESYPGFLVTGNLYRPLTAGKHPGVVCPHGHWKNGRLQDDDVGSVPARCITLARMGCVVFTYDMVGYNDSGKQIANHRFTSERGELWGLGGPLGLQLWNGIRVVDFLQSLPDVDPDRIGCTGASGGGTQTFLLCAVNDRVKVAAPVNMISSTMQGGCVCENAPCLRIDTNNMEIGAMMAPRPLFMVSATGDWTKNTPKVEYPAIREIYRLYGAEDKLGMIQIDAGHNYNRASREAVYRWFGRWLLGRDDMDTFTEPPYQKEKDEDLLVFADRPLPYNAVPNLETLLEWRIGAAKRQLESLRPTDAAKLKQCREVLGEALRLATGAERTRGGEGVEEARDTQVRDGVRIETGVHCDAGRGTRMPYALFDSAEPRGERTSCGTLIVHPKGRSAVLSADGGLGDLVRKPVAAGHWVVAIDVFGVGESAAPQDPKQPRGSTKFFTTFNRTDTAERVCDIVEAIRRLQGVCKDQGDGADAPAVNVVGIGSAGPWCLLACAAVLTESPDMPQMRIVIDANQFDTSREESYRKDLYVPGILRAGGLPAAAALIPPARLFLHNTGDHFDTSWLKDVQSTLPGSRVVVQKDKASDDAIVTWLTEP
ncbi:MAG TPA: acetylxylan esterase, partial [Phycisphaerae bacterium]|nr:acetylxylan esterase [Phycisphaerae bacterium]